MYTKIVLCSILIVFVQHASRILWLLGFHRTLFNHEPGPCRQLEEILGGSEDIALLHNGIVLITSGLSSRDADQGRIYMYDLKQPNSQAEELEFSSNFDQSTFWPHGISAYENPKTGQITVFVINHHPKGDRIEQFIFHNEPYRPSRLEQVAFDQPQYLMEHVETIRDSAIHLADNIVALDEEKFYFTNRHQHTDELSIMIETYLMFSWGTLVFYPHLHDHEKMVRKPKSKGKVMARGFMPNGLVLSPDNRYLYVAASEEVKVYKREHTDEDEELEFIMSLPIEAYIENMSISGDGKKIYLAAANSLSEHMAYIAQNSRVCGSRVFEIEADNHGMLGNLREVYANDGSDISCASSVVVHNTSILIGGPRGMPILCKLCHLL